MVQIIYQPKAEPVLTAAQQAEAVTESRWHQPWSDPVATIRNRVTVGIAVALIASGMAAISPTAEILPERVSYDKWAYRWTDPPHYQQPRRLYEANQRAVFRNEGVQFLETITESRWHMPWSEPVRLKPDIGVTHQTCQWLVKIPHPFDCTLAATETGDVWVARVADYKSRSGASVAISEVAQTLANTSIPDPSNQPQAVVSIIEVGQNYANVSVQSLPRGLGT